MPSKGKRLFDPAPMQRLVVVGLGLIGASFAKGIKQTGYFSEVLGVDLNQNSCRLAEQLAIVDQAGDSLEVCRTADVIVLAVPILAMEKTLQQLHQLELQQVIVTDVGSRDRKSVV